MKNKQSKSKAGLSSGLTSDSKLKGQQMNHGRDDILSANGLSSGQVLSNNLSEERVQSHERNNDSLSNAGAQSQTGVRRVKMRNLNEMNNQNPQSNTGMGKGTGGKETRKGSRVRVRLQKRNQGAGAGNTN